MTVAEAHGDSEQSFAAIAQTLKTTVAALREQDIPFLLGGSLASWARGGPETRHDLDLVVKRQDAERALEVLVQHGFRAERPPEDWLLKAWDGDVLVDLIYAPKGIEVTDDVIERGEVISVLAMDVRVMALEDMISTKLLAMSEHNLDYRGLLRTARALREQVDWDAVRDRTSDCAFASAFFVLVEELGIVPPPGKTTVPAARPGSATEPRAA